MKGMRMPARRSLYSGMPSRARVRVTLFAEPGPGSCPAGREAGFEEKPLSGFNAIRPEERFRRRAAEINARTQAEATATGKTRIAFLAGASLRRPRDLDFLMQSPIPGPDVSMGMG